MRDGRVHACARQWPNVASVIGIDSAPTLLAKAREAAVSLPNVSFREGDGRALPFDADCFDLFTLDSVFSHLPDPKQALKEAFRVMRADARLAVFDGDYATATVALGDHDPLQACVNAMMAGSVTDRHIMRRLSSVVVARGFELMSFRSYGFAEVGIDGYMLTVVDRRADTLYNQGCIGADTAAALLRIP
jgi:ubiquinone/menaquinone biosynthesis C-methylase UbiE